jgi:hypothetical protein
MGKSHNEKLNSFLLFTTHYYGNQIMDEKGGICSTQKGDEKCIQNVRQKLREKAKKKGKAILVSGNGGP